MKRLSYALCFVLCTLYFGAAWAAGTYMGTAGYQSPQRYYQQGAAGGYYQPQNVGTSGYGGGNYYQRVQGGYTQPAQQQANPYGGRQAQQTRQGASGGRGQASGGGTGDGFYLSAGIVRQYAQWNFDMNSTGSVLNFSDIAWNIFDVKGGYRFGDWVIDGGAQYGMQSGASSMTDDDISKGGMLIEQYDDAGVLRGYSATQALSISESKGGSLTGISVGVGMANKLGFGKVKITPSAGYRMFRYKLQSSNTHGLVIATNWCYDNGGGEVICPAYVLGSAGLGQGAGEMTWENPDIWAEEGGEGIDWWLITSQYVSTDSYSFSHAKKSHIYDVAWDGPYVALDFESELNDGNRVDARVEFGMPGYLAKGDQPYRLDWAHPKSVEDKKGMFGALHLGLAANWTTKFNQNWGLTVGLTYDYYNMDKADAETYLNGGYYESILADIAGVSGCDSSGRNCTAFGGADIYGTGENYDNLHRYQKLALSIKELKDDCGGNWVCSTKSEVNSFYRSLGVRVGVAGKF